MIILVVFATDAVKASPSVSNRDTGYTAVIEDEADLLTNSQEEQLLAYMAQITEYGNAAFVTIDHNPYSSTQSYAENYTDSRFGSSSGTLFLIDMDHREIYIDTKGSMRKRITSAYANTITDNIYTYASDADYYTCAYKAFEQIYTLLEGGRIAQPMKYISNAFLAIVLAMLINYFIVMTISRKRKASVSEVMPGIFRKVELHNTRVSFTHQTKHYSPQSSGSGGGGHSGGGGGGGGGHSGGGHSF